MQLTTFLDNGEPRLGLVDGDDVIDIGRSGDNMPSDLKKALKAGVDFQAVADAARQSDAPRLPLAQLRFAPLITEPGKVICLGLNYHDHAKEGGREKPDYPWFFFRGATSLVAHDDYGRLPKVSSKFDYEAEMGVVIGKTVPRHISEEQALDYVFGYTCFNDMSVRDYQKRTPQWTIGKNFDATGGLGPILVTADQLPRGGEGLGIQCRLNGEVMQNANTSDMIWSVKETLCLLAQCLTLEPGDVIAMGTPAGVGQSRKPPVWMRSGDTVEVEIEGIGLLRNRILDEGA